MNALKNRIHPIKVRKLICMGITLFEFQKFSKFNSRKNSDCKIGKKNQFKNAEIRSISFYLSSKTSQKFVSVNINLSKYAYDTGRNLANLAYKKKTLLIKLI